MLDVETGRFVIGEGMEFYPGMTREEFLKSLMFQNELLHPEKDKDRLDGKIYSLRVQTIDGYSMAVSVRFSLHDYVGTIVMSKPEYYNWPNWSEDKTWEEHATEIKAYNDAFVEKQIEGNVRNGNEMSYSYSWGYISSLLDLRDIPRVEVKICYDDVPVLEAKRNIRGAFLSNVR